MMWAPIRRSAIALAIAGSLLIAQPLWAANQQPESKVVTVEGEAPLEGDAKQGAINQALRQAVEQVVGVYVSSETKVENSQTVSDEILTNASGYVSGYDILKEEKRKDTYFVKLSATVGLAPLVDKLKAMGLLRKWTVAVSIASNGVKQRSLEAAETVLNQAVTEAGFNTADQTILAALDDPKVQQALTAGNHLAALKLLRDNNVDVLITGKAFSETNAGSKVETYGGIIVDMSSANGRMDLKAVRVDTGEIIAASAFTAKAAGSGLDTVEAQALEQAGAPAGAFFVEQIARLPAATKSYIKLVVKGVSFSQTRQLLDQLKKVAGVQSVTQKGFQNNQVSYEVDFRGDAAQLSEKLDGKPALKLDLQSVSSGKIEAKAKSK